MRSLAIIIAYFAGVIVGFIWAWTMRPVHDAGRKLVEIKTDRKVEKVA